MTDSIRGYHGTMWIDQSPPRVVHCKRAAYDVYIGRANGILPQSKWANPWVIGKDGTRAEVIARYEAWIKTQPDLMAALPELRGKVLGCWCAPDHDCHGHVLTRLLDSMTETPSILPVFTSHYSIGSSILTLEEVGKTEPGNPVSICDIAKTHGLKQVILCEDRCDGFLEAYKHIQKAGLAQLIYGLRFVVVPDMLDKTPDTQRAESRVIVFLRNTQGYHDVLRLWNRAWVEGHFTSRDSSYGRIDWKTLKSLWTPNLSLALPWASSFLARNTLTFASIVPDLPIPANEATLFKEVDSGLPFAPLIDAAIDRFASDTGAIIQRVKNIYYADSKRDFDAYVTYRAILNRETFGAPGVDHLCSDRFSWSEWQRLTKEVVS